MSVLIESTLLYIPVSSVSILQFLALGVLVGLLKSYEYCKNTAMQYTEITLALKM